MIRHGRADFDARDLLFAAICAFVYLAVSLCMLHSIRTSTTQNFMVKLILNRYHGRIDAAAAVGIAKVVCWISASLAVFAIVLLTGAALSK